MDQRIKHAIGFGYFNFWGALFGLALGGAASAAC
jgi:hypothetical protein